MTNYIHTHIYYGTTTKPEPITKDSRGSEIKVGSKVAYNISGSVVLGVIISIKKNDWIRTPTSSSNGWTCPFSIEIENEDLHISTIKNPNSFIIL